MADIDLKTETPDASLPADGFLFGADSQAAASPSVYTTQSVATRLLGSTTLSGTTITANAPVLDLAQTWNNAAVTFTGAKLNVTDTASNAASLLMDLQVGGTTSFQVDKSGLIASPRVGGLGGGIVFGGTSSNGARAYIGQYGARLNSGINFSWSPSTNLNIEDLLLGRRAAANLRLGAADAAAPVAQTLSVQGVVAGTTNTAGANLTIAGSQGTGTGAGGSIVFQVAPAGSSGTAQNALATALTINSNSQSVFADGSVSLPSIRGSDVDSGIYFSGNNTRIAVDGTLMYLFEGGGNLNMRSTGAVRWSSGGDISGTTDVLLLRDAANTLALRNGANAQTFRVYNTFTDATTFERGNIAWISNVLTIGTEKGSVGGTAREIAFQTDGTTRLSISTVGIATFSGEVRVGESASVRWGTARSRINSPSDGVLLLTNAAATDFGRLQFGGTTSSFPALKRSSTVLQSRLADDSDFAPLQGQLRTHNAYTAGAPTATGYIVLYDSTGTAYKVPAEAL